MTSTYIVVEICDKKVLNIVPHQFNFTYDGANNGDIESSYQMHCNALTVCFNHGRRIVEDNMEDYEDYTKLLEVAREYFEFRHKVMIAISSCKNPVEIVLKQPLFLTSQIPDMGDGISQLNVIFSVCINKLDKDNKDEKDKDKKKQHYFFFYYSPRWPYTQENDKQVLFLESIIDKHSEETSIYHSELVKLREEVKVKTGVINTLAKQIEEKNETIRKLTEPESENIIENTDKEIKEEEIKKKVTFKEGLIENIIEENKPKETVLPTKIIKNSDIVSIPIKQIKRE